jgi:hypothetical protein
MCGNWPTRIISCSFLIRSTRRYTSKKSGSSNQLWSVRVGMHYRALGLDKPEGIVWFWIGPHAKYDKMLS